MKERRRSSLPRHGKGSWDDEKKEKVQGEEISRGRIGEMSSKELVKTRFFSTGHGVKLEGKAVATHGVDSELRLNRKQQAASTTPKVVSSATKAKRAVVAY
ncbi:unnamed protein product [Lactuca virosa]|uniref:Uncharacterized protein n=1 Tax=Lactuca virosa TaxID=75947 RepID=A0AAU9N1A6_9ASTR|nr:unnamed protein product [Lactuca virosa]